MNSNELANLHRYAFAVPGLATKYEGIVAKRMHEALAPKPAEPAPRVKAVRNRQNPSHIAPIKRIMQDGRERTIDEIARSLGTSPDKARGFLASLVKKGYLASKVIYCSDGQTRTYIKTP